MSFTGFQMVQIVIQMDLDELSWLGINSSPEKVFSPETVDNGWTFCGRLTDGVVSADVIWVSLDRRRLS